MNEMTNQFEDEETRAHTRMVVFSAIMTLMQQDGGALDRLIEYAAEASVTDMDAPYTVPIMTNEQEDVVIRVDPDVTTVVTAEGTVTEPTKMLAEDLSTFQQG